MKKLTDTTQSYKPELIKIIKKHLPECKIYLFGSRARKSHREGSDIDVAIDCGRTIDFSILSRIITDIEDSGIPVLVDVVDLHIIDDAMKEEIMKEKIEWTI